MRGSVVCRCAPGAWPGPVRRSGAAPRPVSTASGGVAVLPQTLQFPPTALGHDQHHRAVAFVFAAVGRSFRKGQFARAGGRGVEGTNTQSPC